MSPKITNATGPSYEGAEVANGGVEAEPPVPVGVPAAQSDTGPAVDPDIGDGVSDDDLSEQPPETPPENRRPPVNAGKAEHAAYAAATYGNTAAWWDDEYSKRGLIDELDKLADGTRVMVDGRPTDAQADPDPEAPAAGADPDPAEANQPDTA